MYNDNFSEDSNNDLSVDYEEQVNTTKRQRFSRPKVCDSSFWSNDNIKKLITAIKNYPAIWQTDSEAFKSRAQREVAWQKVAEAFGDEIIDPNQLVAKWQNLRTQYRSVRAASRKYSINKIGKKPAWRFYSQMVFIDNGETNENDDENRAISSPEQIASSSEEIAGTKARREQNRKVVDSSFWSDDNVVKLINAVKKRKSIWNFNDENYKHRAVRESDWLTIGDEFKHKIPVNQLAAKWQNLRTSYRSAKNTAKKLREEQGLIRTPNWKYYSYMTFLDAGEEPDPAQKEDIEELEDDDSIIASDEYAQNETNSETFMQSDLEDNAVKEEYIEENDESINDPLNRTESDNIEAFGNFLVSELRKIKNQSYLEATQRKILQFVWQRIDEEPVTPQN